MAERLALSRVADRRNYQADEEQKRNLILIV